AAPDKTVATGRCNAIGLPASGRHYPVFTAHKVAGRWPANDRCVRLLLVAANLGWRRCSSQGDPRMAWIYRAM
ncbi:TPA: hypothetical protein ACOECF_004465, partial [Stenotrophomonas maltophilia]